jgi:hypothetical protein
MVVSMATAQVGFEHVRRQRRRDPWLMNFGTSICERYDFALIRRSDISNIDAVVIHTLNSKLSGANSADTPD